MLGTTNPIGLRPLTHQISRWLTLFSKYFFDCNCLIFQLVLNHVHKKTGIISLLLPDYSGRFQTIKKQGSPAFFTESGNGFPATGAPRTIRQTGIPGPASAKTTGTFPPERKRQRIPERRTRPNRNPFLHSPLSRHSMKETKSSRWIPTVAEHRFAGTGSVFGKHAGHRPPGYISLSGQAFHAFRVG